jgi:hypothetical protein
MPLEGGKNFAAELRVCGSEAEALGQAREGLALGPAQPDEGKVPIRRLEAPPLECLAPTPPALLHWPRPRRL